MISGVCKHCGCTERRACKVRAAGPAEIGEQFEPCAWLDEDETVCTGCIGNLTEDELRGFWAAELPLLAELPVPLDLSGVAAVYLAAVLDVYLAAVLDVALPKHRTAHRFATQLRKSLGSIFDNPTFCCTAEILRRGALPDPDSESEAPPEPEPRSRLILPGV